MTDVATPPGLSVWEADLLRHLTLHMENEGALLAAYQELAEQADAEYVTYCVNMIIEDEIRHHRLFTELVNALRSSVERTEGPSRTRSSATPPTRRAARGDRTELLDRERADETELKRLRQASCATSGARRCGRSSSRSWSATPRSTRASCAS